MLPLSFLFGILSNLWVNPNMSVTQPSFNESNRRQKFF